MIKQQSSRLGWVRGVCGQQPKGARRKKSLKRFIKSSYRQKFYMPRKSHSRIGRYYLNIFSVLCGKDSHHKLSVFVHQPNDVPIKSDRRLIRLLCFTCSDYSYKIIMGNWNADMSALNSWIIIILTDYCETVLDFDRRIPSVSPSTLDWSPRPVIHYMVSCQKRSTSISPES